MRKDQNEVRRTTGINNQGRRGWNMGIFTGVAKNTSSLETKKMHSNYGELLVDGEIIEVGFVVFRDTFLFTNKRLILVDIKGISGKQIEYLSIPYTKIMKFSVQTGSSFDLDAEMKLWIGSDSLPLEKKFNKDVNVYEVQKVLARHVLK
jgi:hypothetical protein